MNAEFSKLLAGYDYKLPENLIANQPASPRDNAKLLVYNRRKNRATFDRFKNLAKYLPKNAVLVFNQTKVLPARLFLKKSTGGRVKILYLQKQGKDIQVMADRKLKPSSRLYLNPRIFFTVQDKKDRYYLLRPSFSINNLEKILGRFGKTPIPPYIKNSPLSEKKLRKKYQSVFAKYQGSIAAPTASLHFTERLIKKLRGAGLGIQFITLHINLGTFAPLTEKQIAISQLHEEHFTISKKTADFLNRAKQAGKPIIAVGTSVVRALESAASANGRLKHCSGLTNLFIKENYHFRFIDGVITNFHLPESSLLMLAAAFVSRKKIMKFYQAAIKRKFRFFSFGDGMLIT